MSGGVDASRATGPRWGQPDFSGFFEVRGPAEDQVGLTPRRAARLWLSATLVADEYPEMPQLLELRLPAVARGQGHVFLARLRRAAFDLRADLEGGQAPLPRCTGEALVLSWILRDAIMAASGEDEAGQEVAGELLDAVPMSTADSTNPTQDLYTLYDYTLYDVLFEDLDLELMYSLEMDGVEESTTGTQMGMESLRPADWFLPYLHLVDLPPRPSPDDAYGDRGTFTAEVRVSFSIESAAAVKDAAIAHLRSEDVSFLTAARRHEELERVGHSVADALQTLIDIDGPLKDVPGAEEDGGSVHVVEGDMIDHQ